MVHLRQLNVADNMLKHVSGIDKCISLDTLHMKANRLGHNKEGDVESLIGLLACPTLTCLDIQNNYLTDPAIVEEVLVKLPNLKVLYTQGNDFCRKVPSYRKTIINRIKTLTYLDDRPVFEEDRRRAEAYARGGMDEERKEMAIIKKEKSDKHWANHEAFTLMIDKARKDKKEKKEKTETKEEKKANTKTDMKEMMAKAKADKAEAAVKKVEQANG